MITPRKSERGQSIVILALALIGMLGFTALALDGGMAFNQRRQDQSAADASSLAGAEAAARSMELAGFVYDTNLDSCAGGIPSDVGASMGIAEGAAVNRAVTNAYTITNGDLGGQNGVVASYGCHDWGAWADKYIDVHTMITRKVTSIFVQLFVPAGITNTVESIARLRPRTVFYFGNAVVALREDCSGPGENKGGVTFGGSNSTDVNGGGVYSNACMVINGSPDVSAPSFTYRSLPAPIPEPPHTYYTPGTPTMPLFEIDTPRCDLLPVNPHTDRDTTDHDITIYYPGRYTNTIVSHGTYDELRNKGTKLKFTPGLYCLANGVKFTGGFVEALGVTFYLTGGSFETSGGAEIHMEAPTDQTQASQSIVGMLIYLPEGQTEPVKLTGNAGSYYIGAVYAPTATCEVAGTTDGMHDFNSQVVCGTVKITGNATISVNYNKNNTVLAKPKLEQFR